MGKTEIGYLQKLRGPGDGGREKWERQRRKTKGEPSSAMYQDQLSTANVIVMLYKQVSVKTRKILLGLSLVGHCPKHLFIYFFFIC